jgi:hypothetical protein
MKTPREVLFQRHRPAQAALDAVRRKVLAGHFAEAGSLNNDSAKTAQTEREPEVLLPRESIRMSPMVGLARRAWLELIWPCHRAWAGLAAIWLLLLVVNFNLQAPAPTRSAGHAQPVAVVARGWAEQRRALAELLPASKPPQLTAAPAIPGRRSERLLPFKNCRVRVSPESVPAAALIS